MNWILWKVALDIFHCFLTRFWGRAQHSVRWRPLLNPLCDITTRILICSSHKMQDCQGKVESDFWQNSTHSPVSQSSPGRVHVSPVTSSWRDGNHCCWVVTVKQCFTSDFIFLQRHITSSIKLPSGCNSSFYISVIICRLRCVECGPTEASVHLN